jgi:hypothetical protein
MIIESLLAFQGYMPPFVPLDTCQAKENWAENGTNTAKDL